MYAVAINGSHRKGGNTKHLMKQDMSWNRVKFRALQLQVMGLLCLLGVASQSSAADWSITEAHFQYGQLNTPNFAGGARNVNTLIVTFQHASGWKYGSNFFFIDYLNGEDPNFNNRDIYGEWYPNFSIGKIIKKDISVGFIKDFGILAGINFGAQPKVLKFLPGVRLELNLPGFGFANLDITAYIDASAGVAEGGAPKEDDSFMFDFNWAYPFKIGKHIFSIEGHIEYIGERTNEFGNPVSWWILAQPQFRWDVGSANGWPSRFFIGIEWQVWINKLGDPDTHDNAPQALAVWRF